MNLMTFERTCGANKSRNQSIVVSLSQKKNRPHLEESRTKLRLEGKEFIGDSISIKHVLIVAEGSASGLDTADVMLNRLFFV
jgi:hypothetical protein